MLSDFSKKIPIWLQQVRPKKHWGFAVGTLVALVALVAPWLILDPLFWAIFPNLPLDSNVKLGLASVAAGLLSLLIIALALFIYGKKFKDIGWNKPTWDYAKKALGYFVIYFAISLVVQIIATNFFGVNADQQQELGYQNLNGIAKIVAFVALVIVTPVVEETIFRGFMFTGFRQQMSFYPAAIICSALFGLAHGQWNVGLDVFVMGVISCYLLEKTKSLWPSIFLHVIKNSVAFYLLYLYNGG